EAVDARRRCSSIPARVAGRLDASGYAFRRRWRGGRRRRRLRTHRAPGRTRAPAGKSSHDRQRLARLATRLTHHSLGLLPTLTEGEVAHDPGGGHVLATLFRQLRDRLPRREQQTQRRVNEDVERLLDG